MWISKAYTVKLFSGSFDIQVKGANTKQWHVFNVFIAPVTDIS